MSSLWMAAGASGSVHFSSFYSTFSVVTSAIAAVAEAKTCPLILFVTVAVLQWLAFAKSSFNYPLRVQKVATWPCLCLSKVAEKMYPDFALTIRTCQPTAALTHCIFSPSSSPSQSYSCLNGVAAGPI